MQEYELCVLFPGSKTEEENTETAKAVVEPLLSAANAEIKYSYPLGRKKMAYEISRQTHGDYRVWLFNAEKDAIHALNEKLRLSQEIIRHLIIKLETVSIEEKIKAMEEPKKELVDDEPEAKKDALKAHDKNVTFVDEAPKEQPEQEAPAKKDEKKVSLDQLDKKLDELLESDTI